MPFAPFASSRSVVMRTAVRPSSSRRLIETSWSRAGVVK